MLWGFGVFSCSLTFLRAVDFSVFRVLRLWGLRALWFFRAWGVVFKWLTALRF